MMSFGSALEALKSGERIARGNTAYEYRLGDDFVRVLRDTGVTTVSTTTGSFSVFEVMAEDWIIAGYGRQGLVHSQEHANVDHQQAALALEPESGDDNPAA